jgi:anti-sigma B factor antagonist
MDQDEWDEGPTVGLDADDLLYVTTRQLAAAVVVAAAGEIDLSTVDNLAVAVRAALASHAGMVVIDLTEVQFLASTGLSVLVEAERAAGENSQLLRVVAGEHHAVARSLEMSGLADHLTVCTNLEAALRAA